MEIKKTGNRSKTGSKTTTTSKGMSLSDGTFLSGRDIGEINMHYRGLDKREKLNSKQLSKRFEIPLAELKTILSTSK